MGSAARQALNGARGLIAMFGSHYLNFIRRKGGLAAEPGQGLWFVGHYPQLSLLCIAKGGEGTPIFSKVKAVGLPTEGQRPSELVEGVQL